MNTDFLITGIHRIIMVGKEEYPENVTRFHHSLHTNELIFHFSGESTVRFNGQVFSIQPSCIRFLPKGNVSEYVVEQKIPGECIDIFFDTDRPVSEQAFVFPMPKAIKTATLFKQIFSVWVAKNDGYYFESLSLLYEILSQLQKNDYLPEKQFSLIRPGVEYLTKNFYRTDLTVEMLADLCGLSYSYFKRLFLKKYKTAPKRYLIGLRINYACDKLYQDDLSISHISDLCGFSDPAYFTRQFKLFMGISPSQFRRKYRSSK